MRPAHLTASNRKVPQDIWVMNERRSVRFASLPLCIFLVRLCPHLGLNKPSLRVRGVHQRSSLR